jgi:hypothetical protein
MWNWLAKSPTLEERAEAAAKQMRYFQLFSRRGAFDEIGASARRAGFVMVQDGPFEASFHWPTDGSPPDFTFHVFLDDREEMSVTAKSCAADLFGLVMTSYLDEPNISVEKDSQMGRHQFGRNADPFQSLILGHQDFDDGIERLVRRASIDPSLMTSDFR